MGLFLRPGRPVRYAAPLVSVLIGIALLGCDTPPERLSEADYRRMMEERVAQSLRSRQTWLGEALPYGPAGSLAERREQLERWRRVLEFTAAAEDVARPLVPPERYEEQHEALLSLLAESRREIAQYLIPAITRGDPRAAQSAADRFEEREADAMRQLPDSYQSLVGLGR